MMTRDEFLELDKFSVIRRLGVSYRVDDQWNIPGANYGEVELTAYRQVPIFRVYIHPDNEKWLSQAHYIGDWKSNPSLHVSDELAQRQLEEIRARRSRRRYES